MKEANSSRANCLIAVSLASLAGSLFAQGPVANPSKEYIYVNGKLTVVEIRSTSQVTADSVSPLSGNTANATLTAAYSDTAGYAQLGSVHLLVNAGLSGSSACWVTYQRASNTLMLMNDAANGWLGPIVAGSGTALQNTQCVLNGSGSSGLGSGNSVTLTVSLSFKPAFAGSKTVFLTADGGGLTSGWQSRGTWTVPGTAVVTADSVSPLSGNTASSPCLNPRISGQRPRYMTVS